MILLALHQSLEQSIQVVAAKLLTHLATAHRAIVQPLAWSHIRQSFSLMDFLKTVDPQRAIIEACIISNLLFVKQLTYAYTLMVQARASAQLAQEICSTGQRTDTIWSRGAQGWPST